MKKTSIITFITMVAIFLMSSCNNYQPKEVKLANQNDSLNYTLGLSNGKGIKDYYMQTDTTDKAIAALMEALDKAFEGEASTDEMYKLGLQIGNSFKQQKKQGLMGDSTLVFDSKLVKQGLVNALKDYKEGMSAEESEEYIRKVMMEIQDKKMQQQMPQQAPETPADTIVQ
ncbi:MAG: hypothetical protein JXR27_01340 [Paludibacteraceae bacterium]|nr:hypothetical protein [Paludibacteraceae bacterium]